MKPDAMLREPLTHFFVLGLCVYLLYAWFDRGANADPAAVVVDEARVGMLSARFARTWQRLPTSSELQGLIDGWIREEIMYREGRALRLGENDPVVRRRVAQKMDFISDSLEVPPAPTEQELQEWLDAHPEDYRVPAEYSLSQIFFDPSRRGDRLADHIERVLAALEQGRAGQVTGDATLLPYHMSDAPADQIAGVFGDGFAEALAALPVGLWAGPVESAYGLHLVLVEDANPGRQPTLEEVRAVVERDLLGVRIDQANDAYYDRLREKYKLRIAEDIEFATKSPVAE